MRIEIKTKNPVVNHDLKAMYVIDHAFENLCSPRMVKATLEFFADRFGYVLARKQ